MTADVSNFSYDENPILFDNPHTSKYSKKKYDAVHTYYEVLRPK